MKVEQWCLVILLGLCILFGGCATPPGPCEPDYHAKAVAAAAEAAAKADAQREYDLKHPEDWLDPRYDMDSQFVIREICDGLDEVKTGQLYIDRERQVARVSGSTDLARLHAGGNTIASGMARFKQANETFKAAHGGKSYDLRSCEAEMDEEEQKAVVRAMQAVKT